MDVLIKIKDREGVVHELQAPTDMAMNVMELCKAFFVKSNSRLGCQIPITMDLDGLELELAPEN